ncbi:helix-turn-helix transcriptional regulator [Paenibacillus sp. 1P07SE]|uniref:helix-turn-helix transcriptional regulator n=1 Tax=Paenibacillus sp. 1P07SE TaxID=3132209 RepID=UPI0039A709A3
MLLQFEAPPLPHYIVSGASLMPAGRKHPSRRAIGVFDLIAVSEGCLYMGEAERSYEVMPGHALILRPDSHHYATLPCSRDSSYYWLHFQTTGSWEAVAREHSLPAGRLLYEEADWSEAPADPSLAIYAAQTFPIILAQFTRLLQPRKLYERIEQLIGLQQRSHLGSVRWKQQQLFQEVLQLLSASLEAPPPSASMVCAEAAASYIREHYQEGFTAQQMGESLRFHPVYIARCMQRHLGCSPSEYLLRFRIDQAKLLLLQSDLPISRIAEAVGFNQAAYFTASFTKLEGLSPRSFRQRFLHG